MKHSTHKKMDKIKIKRVKRNKKKVTNAEKIMAGLGVGTGLLGGLGGGAVKSQPQPRQNIVSTVKDKNKSAGIKEKLAEFFTIPTAQASDQNGMYDDYSGDNGMSPMVGSGFGSVGASTAAGVKIDSSNPYLTDYNRSNQTTGAPLVLTNFNVSDPASDPNVTGDPSVDPTNGINEKPAIPGEILDPGTPLNDPTLSSIDPLSKIIPSDLSLSNPGSVSDSNQFVPPVANPIIAEEYGSVTPLNVDNSVSPSANGLPSGQDESGGNYNSNPVVAPVTIGAQADSQTDPETGSPINQSPSALSFDSSSSAGDNSVTVTETMPPNIALDNGVVQTPTGPNNQPLIPTGQNTYTDSAGQNKYLVDPGTGAVDWFDPSTGSYTPLANMPDYAKPAAVVGTNNPTNLGTDVSNPMNAEENGALTITPTNSFATQVDSINNVGAQTSDPNALPTGDNQPVSGLFVATDNGANMSSGGVQSPNNNSNNNASGPLAIIGDATDPITGLPIAGNMSPNSFSVNPGTITGSGVDLNSGLPFDSNQTPVLADQSGNQQVDLTSLSGIKQAAADGVFANMTPDQAAAYLNAHGVTAEVATQTVSSGGYSNDIQYVQVTTNNGTVSIDPTQLNLTTTVAETVAPLNIDPLTNVTSTVTYAMGPNNEQLVPTGNGTYTDSGGENKYIVEPGTGTVDWYDPSTGSYTAVANMPDYAKPSPVVSTQTPSNSPDALTIIGDNVSSGGVPGDGSQSNPLATQVDSINANVSANQNSVLPSGQDETGVNFGSAGSSAGTGSAVGFDSGSSEGEGDGGSDPTVIQYHEPPRVT